MMSKYNVTSAMTSLSRLNRGQEITSPPARSRSSNFTFKNKYANKTSNVNKDSQNTMQQQIGIN